MPPTEGFPKGKAAAVGEVKPDDGTDDPDPKVTEAPQEPVEEIEVVLAGAVSTNSLTSAPNAS